MREIWDFDRISWPLITPHLYLGHWPILSDRNKVDPAEPFHQDLSNRRIKSVFQVNPTQQKTDQHGSPVWFGSLKKTKGKGDTRHLYMPHLPNRRRDKSVWRVVSFGRRAPCDVPFGAFQRVWRPIRVASAAYGVRARVCSLVVQNATFFSPICLKLNFRTFGVIIFDFWSIKLNLIESCCELLCLVKNSINFSLTRRF